MSSMQRILGKVGIRGIIVEKFLEEKITPDVVCLMSRDDWAKVGLECNGKLAMKIRLFCVNKPDPQLECSSEKKPRYFIPKEQIEELLVLRVPNTEIAARLGISVKTLKRRMIEYGLQKHTATCAQDLQAAVREVLDQHPNTGETMLQGHLASRNMRVPRQQLWDAARIVDPNGAVERSSRRLKCRTYYVQGPNELWHIDGNHKLIRWGFVVHAAVDGFSRFPTFVHASNNNRAMTVLASFVEAVTSNGVPVRVRADAGGENILVQRFMEQLRGAESHCFIIGRSTHNQRIERLWRDIFVNVLCQFHQKFHEMEDQGILDPDNRTHLAALHCIFLPVINQHLMEWQEAWAHHKIRTVGRCPYDMFVFGMQPAQGDQSLLCSVDEALQQLHYGHDPPSVDTLAAVEVPEDKRNEINTTIDSWAGTAAELYCAILAFIE